MGVEISFENRTNTIDNSYQGIGVYSNTSLINANGNQPREGNSVSLLSDTIGFADSFVEVASPYISSESRDKINSGYKWLKKGGNILNKAGSAISIYNGFKRVFTSLDRDIKSNSQLFERTMMSIPVAMIETTAPLAAASFSGALASSALAAAGLGATAVAGAGILVGGAALLGTGYLVSQGIDYIDSWMS